MRNFLKGLWQDESGASAAEYALLLAIVAGVIAVAADGLATAVGDAMDDAASCITTDGATCDAPA